MPRKLENLQLPRASVEAALDVDILTKALRNHAAAQQFGISGMCGRRVINFDSPKIKRRT